MGYDTTGDDYKIIMISIGRPTRAKISSEILALKSGSWRSSEYPTGIHRLTGFYDTGMDYLAFVHGAFHWVGLSRYYTIVSFNISNEVYGVIQLLEQMCYNLERETTEKSDIGLSILEGMLCFYSTYNRGVGNFNLWVMKDYGVKESWTVLLTIQDSNLYSLRPRYRYADGEVLLRCRPLQHLYVVEYTTSKGPFGLCLSKNVL
ncbi:F-box protein CPR1-like [Lycium ferocissimum]|uniref:F-box protein CPR1-like n=1 Tax=Lycium ferocissimum TaxID=112874 RepID=UPI0028150D40|nr:F-box protein CPR1-like [Lycium ferocissimum]